MTEGNCYIGRDKCGCAVAATVCGSGHTAQDVKEFIDEGLTIELVSVEWVRTNMRRCPHKEKPPAQNTLFNPDQPEGK